MTSLRVATLDDNGHLHPDVLPAGAAGGGGPQAWEWYFPGEVTVRSGLAVRRVPSGVAGIGSIVPLALMATLATIGTYAANARVRLALMVDGVVRQSVTIPAGTDGTQATILDRTPLRPGSLVTVDVIEATGVNPVRAADLTVALWWSHAAD